MQRAELDFFVPPELIAQAPLRQRHAARLLVLQVGSGEVTHHRVEDLPELLPSALFVANDTRVLAARLHGKKTSGGSVELLLVERVSEAGHQEVWRAMLRASKPWREGTVIAVPGPLQIVVQQREADGLWRLQLTVSDGAASASEVVERCGELPLPPYIQRGPNLDDRQRYQTTFALQPGAVAAPTAGLHFSRELLDRLRAAGHGWKTLTLHVGPGTFLPLRAADLADHRMHAEHFVLPTETAAAVQQARTAGRPVVAIGTTVARTLECRADREGVVAAGAGCTRLFIYPPYRFRAVDVLLTNFHLPHSTLLALVMAFGGIEAVRRAYAIAVEQRYRFFSYGDAMLLLRGSA